MILFGMKNSKVELFFSNKIQVQVYANEQSFLSEYTTFLTVTIFLLFLA